MTLLAMRPIDEKPNYPLHLVPKGPDFAQIKEIRRSRLSRASDEALSELDDLTWLLRIKNKHV